MSEERHFLVTGANGFIGTRLVHELIRRRGAGSIWALMGPGSSGSSTAREFERLGVRILDADLMGSLPPRPEVPAFQTVFHLAAHAATEEVDGAFEINSEGTRRLLDWLGPSLRHARIIHTGTLASMDRKTRQGPASESISFESITPYGQTKMEGEAWIQRLAPSLGYTFTIVRLCTVIGPGFRSGGMFAVFPKLLARGAWSTRLAWPGHASFLHVEDAARLLVELAEAPAHAGQIYLASNGEAITFDQLLSGIAARLNVSRRSIHPPAPFWDVLHRVSDQASRMGWVPARARIFFWRVAKLCSDDLSVDSTKLHRAQPMQYRSVAQALDEIYGKPRF